MTVVLVAVAGALGALARHAVQVAVARRLRRVTPWGTAVVNVSGSLALGVLVGMLVAREAGSLLVTVAGTGFLGAYTTFSTWMVETVALLEARRWGAAVANIAGAALAGTAAAALGLWLGLRAGAPS